MVSSAEVANQLRSRGGREAFSPLFGHPCLVVDLSDQVAVPETLAACWTAGLRELACPSIAWCPEPGGHDRRRAFDFDVVVSEEAELEAIVETCVAQPLASLALVQLLRRSEESSIHAGLESESLVYSTLQAGPGFSNWLSARDPERLRRPAARPGLPLRVKRSGAVLELVLDRPEKRNAFSAQLRDALAEALDVVLADSGISEVQWRAEGPAFCAGGDLDEFGTLPDPATAHAIRSTRNVARLVAACAERLRVEVQGACVGAGVELPAFAARVVARHDAFFALPEVGMGLVPGAGGTVSLPRRIGRQRTAWMALTGAKVDAKTALQWRLIDELSD